MLNLKTYLSAKRKLVDTELDRFLNNGTQSTTLMKAMRYSLMAGGKRLRPILCLAATTAVGGDESAALPAACAMEMIHTYSLIHDDLPAMDNDDLRRGKPTCHVQFDEATAILAGDGLLTLAFDTLAQAGKASRIGADTWLSVIQNLSAAAGYRGMIEGQMQDMAAEGQRLSAIQLETMHGLKTGRMIEVALHIGARLGNASDRQLSSLTEFGRKVGLAFQVADDILNVNGDPEHMGKAVGTDLSRGKNTYPALMGMTESQRFARELVEQALHAIAYFDNNADPLRLIARYTIHRNR